MPIPFEPNCPGFSIVNAYFLAKTSAAAYALGDAFTASVAELGLGTVTAPTVLVDDIRYFIGSTDQFVVLAFRGTVVNNIHNWLSDATIEQIADKFGSGLVHRGFSDGLSGEWQEMFDALRQLVAEGRTLWVTGHSLGGGLATLASQWLSANKVPVQGTYTYGSPRVGNVDFYQNYGPVSYRFVNNSDIVPHVPLEISAWGLRAFFYKHIGTLQYLDRHGNLGDGMSDWEVKKEFMINEVASVAQDWDACIADHSLDKYINAIGQNLATKPAAAQNVPDAAKAT